MLPDLIMSIIGLIGIAFVLIVYSFAALAFEDLTERKIAEHFPSVDVANERDLYFTLLIGVWFSLAFTTCKCEQSNSTSIFILI